MTPAAAALVWSLFAASGTVAAIPRESPPTDYSAYSKVEIVYAEVLEWEPRTECRGAACIPLPLLKVRVDAPLDSTLKGEAVFEVRYSDAPPSVPEKIVPGEYVLITFTRESAPKKWSCGELRKCSPKPRATLKAIELFRRLAWVSE